MMKNFAMMGVACGPSKGEWVSGIRFTGGDRVGGWGSGRGVAMYLHVCRVF